MFCRLFPSPFLHFINFVVFFFLFLPIILLFFCFRSVRSLSDLLSSVFSAFVLHISIFRLLLPSFLYLHYIYVTSCILTSCYIYFTFLYYCFFLQPSFTTSYCLFPIYCWYFPHCKPLLIPTLPASVFSISPLFLPLFIAFIPAFTFVTLLPCCTTKSQHGAPHSVIPQVEEAEMRFILKKQRKSHPIPSVNIVSAF